MTTIVWRDGVLAADRRAYSGDKAPIGAKRKIGRLADGSLLGVSSSCVGAPALIQRWVESGAVAAADALKPENFQAILIRPNGQVFYAKDNLDWSGPLDTPFLAIGSGDHFALGALEMGASAPKAVLVASALDPWTGGGVDTLTLEPAP